LTAWRGALPFALVMLLAFAVSIYFTAPGWMGIDSGSQLDQARAFQFQDDLPVLMALLWHYIDRVIPGPLGMLLPMTALYWAGFGLVFWALPGGLVPRLIGCLLVACYPPVFSNVPAIYKDTLMQAALLGALGCFVIEGRRWAKLRVLLGVALVAIAIGARHNAAAAAFPLLAIPLIRFKWLGRFSRWRRLLLALSAALVIAFGLMQGVKRSLAPLAQPTDFWQILPAFDLAGMSLRVNESLFDRKTGVLTRGMGVEELRELYNPTYANALYYCIPFRGQPCVHLLNHIHDPQKLELLRKNWLQAILQHPGAYLKHRGVGVRTLLELRKGTVGIYYVKGGPVCQYGRDYPEPARAVALMSWMEDQVQAVWFRPWLYFFGGALFLPLGLILYLRGASIVPFACALSGFAYMLSFFATIGSSDYRYTVWTTLTTLTAVGCTLISVLAARRKRARERTPAPEHSEAALVVEHS
jgi:hypothetical protein